MIFLPPLYCGRKIIRHLSNINLDVFLAEKEVTLFELDPVEHENVSDQGTPVADLWDDAARGRVQHHPALLVRKQAPAAPTPILTPRFAPRLHLLSTS